MDSAGVSQLYQQIYKSRLSDVFQICVSSVTMMLIPHITACSSLIAPMFDIILQTVNMYCASAWLLIYCMVPLGLVESGSEWPSGLCTCCVCEEAGSRTVCFSWKPAGGTRKHCVAPGTDWWTVRHHSDVFLGLLCLVKRQVISHRRKRFRDDKLSWPFDTFSPWWGPQAQILQS